MNFNARFTTKLWIKIIALIAVSELQTWRIWSYAGKNICRTNECYDLALMYRQAMNSKVRPCNNFFEYVCQKWGKHHVPAHYATFWSVNQDLQEKALAELIGIIKGSKVTKPIEKLAIRLYEECMDRPSLGYLPPGDVKAIIKNFYYWPIFDIRHTVPSTIKWWTADRYYLELTGESAFFEINYITNKENTDISTQLFEPISAYGSIIRQTKWLPEELDNYKLYLTELIKIVAPTKNIRIQGNTFESYLDQVIDFRRKLDNVRRCCPGLEYEEMMFKHFQKFYETYTTDKPNAAANWPSYFRHLRGPRRNSMLTDDTPLIVRTPFFVKLISLVQETPLPVLINHIHIFFAERHILVNTNLQRVLGKTVTMSGISTSGHLRILPPKKNMCIYRNSLRYVLEDMYTEVRFTPQTKLAVDKLFHQLKDTLIMDIFNSTWLNYFLKETFVRKVRDMRINISRNVRPVKELIMSTNALYSVTNSITMTAPLFQLPMFGLKLPDIVNYAAMGALLGHEMYHAFDVKRVSLDESGKPYDWSAEMITTYKKQAECVEAKYTLQKEMWLAQYGIKYNFSDSTTIHEDIADTMGLQLAYKVYREQAKEDKAVCKLLPNFEKFNCDMLFFTAFAHTYCSASTVTHDIRKHVTGRHSTPVIRINAAVANMPEFTTAFSCKSGDYLFTRKRCNLWS